MSAPALPGRGDLARTAAYLAGCQDDSGAIPWEAGGKVDPWDHVECAMALLVAGRVEQAGAAYAWLARQQRGDGTWPREWHLDGGPRVTDPNVDTNFTAYVAVGVRHHWLVRRDAGFVARMWPVVAAALDAVAALQLPGGGIAWGVGPLGPARSALVAGSASVCHALRCGLHLADVVGERRPCWAAAAARLARALDRDEGTFEDKRRYSMDWYYPVLAGVLRGARARRRLGGRWDDFVVPGLGIRCVEDHPWVTGAETCELALALEALGCRSEAAALVRDMQHLRDDDGSYHTGFVYTDGKRWPIERSTWTGAAVILAVDALTGGTPGADVFRN